MKKIQFILFSAVLLLALQLAADTVKAKYVFLFIGDGMGENIRTYYQNQYPENNLDDFPVTVKTNTNNALNKTTDSAAAGTAIACGVKTYNGAMGVNQDKNPVTSLAKIMRDNNFRIGIITSVGLNDATPGAHYANRLSRKDYAGVLGDLFASDFDFFAGGWIFYPEGYTQKNYAKLLKQAKYEFRDTLTFDEKAPFRRAVYVAKMDPAWPQQPQTRHLLAETTAFAAEKLSRKDKGFFIMVEGGAIDHRAHGNDLAGTMREMHEFDQAIKVAFDFMKKHPAETLIVVTSDHDTGGLNIDKEIKGSLWQQQPYGSGTIESEFRKLFPTASDEELMNFLCKTLGLNEFTNEEKAIMQEALTAQRDPELRKGKKHHYRSMYGSYNPVVIQAMRIRDKRCGLSWTGFNHTDRQVLTNAIGAGADHFKNIKENTDISSAISMAVFGKDVMPEARKTTPHLVVRRAEDYYNFISASCDKLIFRYARHNNRPLEFTLEGNGSSQKFSSSERVGRIGIKDLQPGKEYTMTVKDNDKVIAQVKASTTVKPTGKLITRFGLVSDPHVSLEPDVRYGRMHTQSYPRLQVAFKKLQDSKVDFIAMPGDVTDASKMPELKEVAKAMKKFPKMTFYAVPGNHDYMNKKDFKAEWVKVFGPTARLEKRDGVQILLLDTYNGKLADKPENLKAIEELDPALPVLVLTHSQLVADTYLTDPDRAIHDGDKDQKGQLKTPELAKTAVAALEKLAQMRGAILVGHKNVATVAKLGKLWQLNLPQLTQYPAGFLYAELYSDGLYVEYRTGLNVFYEEYSRLRGAFYGFTTAMRDTHSLKYWNTFYKFD